MTDDFFVACWIPSLDYFLANVTLSACSNHAERKCMIKKAGEVLYYQADSKRTKCLRPCSCEKFDITLTPEIFSTEGEDQPDGQVVLYIFYEESKYEINVR